MTRRHEAPRPTPRPRDRTLVVAVRFIGDLQHWVAVDPRTALKVLRVMIEIQKDPRGGIAKPERLKHSGQRDCSRRITQEHRMVYRYDDEHIEFVSARFHYA